MLIIIEPVPVWPEHDCITLPDQMDLHSLGRWGRNAKIRSAYSIEVVHIVV